MMRSGELPVGGRSHSVNAPAGFGMPSVFCPFPSRISPHAAEVQRYSVGWATRHGFLPTAPARSAFARARFAHLMARAYPHASLPDLCLVTSWLTVTFMLDDHLESVLATQPERQRALGEVVLGYLRRTGGPGPDRDGPGGCDGDGSGGCGAGPAGADGHGGGARVELAAALGRSMAGALCDVWARTVVRTTPGWRRRFIADIATYLDANAWEAANRRAGRVPGVDEYVSMRWATAAAGMFFDLIEVLGGADLPAGAPAEPVLLALREHAANVVAWFNDLVSWPKELLAGDLHNLVLVLRHERRLRLPDAVRAAVERHDAEVRAFVTARAALADRPGPVRQVGDGLAYWIRANVDWSRESGRYAAPEPSDGPTTPRPGRGPAGAG
jgi:terpene synthase-like protein